MGLIWTPTIDRSKLGTLHFDSCSRASKNPVKRIPLQVNPPDWTLIPCNFCKPPIQLKVSSKGKRA